MKIEGMTKPDPTPRNPLRKMARGIHNNTRLKTLRKRMAARSALLLRRSNHKKGLLERLIFT